MKKYFYRAFHSPTGLFFRPYGHMKSNLSKHGKFYEKCIPWGWLEHIVLPEDIYPRKNTKTKKEDWIIEKWEAVPVGTCLVKKSTC